MTVKGVVNLYHWDGAEVPTTDPVVTFAIATGEDTVNVSFDQHMRAVSAVGDNDVLDPSHYVIGGSGVPRTVTSVAVVNISPTTVELTLNGEMTDGAGYNVTVSDVVSYYAAPLDTRYNDANFTGQGAFPTFTVPQVSVTESQLTVEFSELMDHDAALETASNYQIAGPTTITVTSAAAVDTVDRTLVTCQLSNEAQGGSPYTMTVSNVRDASWNEIQTPGNVASFDGVGVPPQVNPSATAINFHTVRVVFNERVLHADEAGSYSILPALAVNGPLGVIDDYTYELDTGFQTAGASYTITVSSAVTDLPGNPIDSAHDEAVFTGLGYSPPEITMAPGDGSTGVSLRKELLVTARDPLKEFTGIDMSSWWVRVAYLPGDDRPLVTKYAVQGGVIQPGFRGGVYAGDPYNQDVGITLWVLPSTGRWLPDTEYTVTSYVQDNEAAPNTNLQIGSFYTGRASCFEDNLPDPTSTDAAMTASIAQYPNCSKLRSIILENCSASPYTLARVRTLLSHACATDLKTTMAGYLDFSLVDSIRLCDKLPLMDLYAKLSRFSAAAYAAIDEVPNLTNQARNLIRQRLRSPSAVYVVNAIAVTVVMCSLLAAGE